MSATNLGHCHPAVVQAVVDSVQKSKTLQTEPTTQGGLNADRLSHPHEPGYT